MQMTVCIVRESVHERMLYARVGMNRIYNFLSFNTSRKSIQIRTPYLLTSFTVMFFVVVVLFCFLFSLVSFLSPSTVWKGVEERQTDRERERERVCVSCRRAPDLAKLFVYRLFNSLKMFCLPVT